MIGRILEEASRHPELSEHVSDMIDRLLVKSDPDPDRDAVLTELFDSIVRINRKPSKEALDTLADVKRRLGMDTSRPVVVPKIPLRRRTYLRVAVAAAVVFVVAGISFLSIFKNGAGSGMPDGPLLSVHTIEDINKDIYLSDNTHIWINENSTLTYPDSFSGERHVKLEGEAYFEVEHDRYHPFFVHTEHLDLEVLGTEFDVVAYPETPVTEVMVFEGRVKAMAGNRSRKVNAGEKLIYDHLSGDMNVEKITSRPLSDWRTESIEAKQKTMPQLLHMVANYYNVTIHFEQNRFSATELYSVSFDKDDDVRKVLQILSEVGGFGYGPNADDPSVYVISYEP